MTKLNDTATVLQQEINKLPGGSNRETVILPAQPKVFTASRYFTGRSVGHLVPKPYKGKRPNKYGPK